MQRDRARRSQSRSTCFKLTATRRILRSDATDTRCATGGVFSWWDLNLGEPEANIPLDGSLRCWRAIEKAIGPKALTPSEAERRAQDDLHTAWFHLLGTVVSPNTPASVAAQAAYRLSWYMPTVNAWWAWTWWVLVLEEAADCIWEREAYRVYRKNEIRMPPTYAVHAMLVGYAVECALKGLSVRRGNAIVANGRYVGVKGARDHDLVQLAAAVGFAPTVKEIDILRRLSRFVLFAGRYPVAKTPDKMLPDGDDAIGKVDVGYFSPQDFRLASSIVNKVMRQGSSKKRRVSPRMRMPARYVRMPD